MALNYRGLHPTVGIWYVVFDYNELLWIVLNFNVKIDLILWSFAILIIISALREFVNWLGFDKLILNCNNVCPFSSENVGWGCVVCTYFNIFIYNTVQRFAKQLIWHAQLDATTHKATNYQICSNLNESKFKIFF